jgi:hypothetical protein
MMAAVSATEQVKGVSYMINPKTHVEFADRPMENLEAMKHILLTFEQHMEKRGWGDDVTANAVMGTMGMTSGLTGESGEAMNVYGISEIPIPEELQANPPMALQMLADEALAAQLSVSIDPNGEEEPEHYPAVRELMETWARPDFRGFLISIEAFSITSDEPDADEFTRENKITSHPNRVEQRLVTFLASQEQQFIVLRRNRGDGDEQVDVGVVPAGNSGAHVSLQGAVPQAMITLTTAALISRVRQMMEAESGD